MSDDEDELRHKITHWFTVLTFARSKYATSGKAEDLDSMTYAQAKMNQYEGQLATLTGHARADAIPFCTSGTCTQRMSSYGTQTWLCGICDFRQCVGCKERVVSLTAVECSHCGYVVGAPKSADEELD